MNYYKQSQIERAHLILNNDFEKFINPIVDPVYARTVPHELLRALFGPGPGWIAFCSRTQKRWTKFIKTQKIPDIDKILLTRNLYEALGE